MKQTVVKVDINCEKCQKEIIAKVGKINGIKSISVDEKKKTVTVVGNVEPARIFKALKKINKNPEILTVGPAKPKCAQCQYLQSVCTCGIGSTYNIYPSSLYPPPLPRQAPFYDPYYQPPPPCYPSSSSFYWPNNRQCELVGVAYPPSSDYYDKSGSCSIV